VLGPHYCDDGADLAHEREGGGIVDHCPGIDEYEVR
jgi:hypothetical protein